jgi:hypothetical protein
MSKGCGRTDHPVLLFRLILALLLLEGIRFGGEGFPSCEIKKITNYGK